MSPAARDPEVVAAHLRRLDAEAWRTLVADLWESRGYAVERADGVVVAIRDGARTTIAPVARSDEDAADGAVDVVVAQRPGGAAADLAARHGARLLGPADVRAMLLFAIDRETGRRLCERHLGAPPEALEPPPRLRARRLLAGLDASRVPDPGPVVAVLALVGAAVAASGWALAGPAVVGAAGPLGGSVTGDRPTATERATAAGMYPPGIDEGGVADVAALAAAHRRALAGNYTVRVTVVRPEGDSPGPPRMRRSVRAAVAGDRYHMVWSVATPEGRKTVRAVYGDGTRRYVRESVNGTTVYRPARYGTERETVTPDPLALRYTLVRRYLSTPTTRLLGSTREGALPGVRVAGSGRPGSPTLADAIGYEVRAVVAPDGHVRRLVATYTRDSTRGRYDVRVEVAYGQVGLTHVEPPAWYERRFGRNATAGESTSDAATGGDPTSDGLD